MQCTLERESHIGGEDIWDEQLSSLQQGEIGNTQDESIQARPTHKFMP